MFICRVCYSIQMFLTEMQALEWGQPLFLNGGMLLMTSAMPG